MTNMVQFSNGVLVEQSNFNKRRPAPLPTFTPKPVEVTKVAAPKATVVNAAKAPVAPTSEALAAQAAAQAAATAAATQAKAAQTAAQAAAEEAARLDAQAARAYAEAQAKK
jgi:hypothetical protein